MSKPTGKLLFAYQTIADLEVERDTLRTANQRLEGEVARMREALEHARLFIRNGIDLGCIRMPDADTPDPAHHTLPMINAALSTANGEVKP